MLSKLSNCPYISLSFDESLYSSVQKNQIDIIRYWDSETNCVVTRYLGSKLMGTRRWRCFTAEDFLQLFLAGISDLEKSKILQVASDCPNVNLFLKNFSESREEKELLYLLDIGRSEVQVIHNSFKTGVKKGSNWELQKLLKAMWKFHQEAPTRNSLH